jgi:hypothetical protein
MSILKRAYKTFMGGPIFVIIFGMIFFGIGGGLTYKQYIFKQKSVQVQGNVTGHVMGSCDDDGCSYNSVVSFTTQDGISTSYTSTFSSSPPAYDVGDTVIVFYSPENPKKAVIKGEGIVLRTIFMTIGGVIIIFGFYIFSSNLKNSYLSEE